MRPLTIILLIPFVPLYARTADSAAGLPHYGREAGNTRYSPVEQIGRHNVARLTQT